MRDIVSVHLLNGIIMRLYCSNLRASWPTIRSCQLMKVIISSSSLVFSPRAGFWHLSVTSPFSQPLLVTIVVEWDSAGTPVVCIGHGIPHNSSPSKGHTKLMQWCRPSPKINSGRTLIPSDVILKIVVIRSGSSGVKSVIFNPFSWTKKRRQIFLENRGPRDGGFSHTFCKSVFFPPCPRQ